MPGGNKKGGGLKSSPVYKMKGFTGFGNSPVKQTKGEHAKWAKEFDAWTDKKFTYSKTRGNMPGPKIKNIPKLDMTLNDNLNKAVKGKGPGSPRTLAAKEFLRRNTIKTPKAKTLSRPFGPGTRPLSPKVTSDLKTVGKSIRKAGKFLGGRFLGIAGMLGSTLGTADTTQKGMSMQQEENLVKRVRKMKKK